MSKKSKVVTSSVGQVKVVTDKHDNVQFQIPTCFAQAYYLDTKGNSKRQHYISFGAKSTPYNLSLAESQKIHLQAAMSSGTFVAEDESKYKHPDKQLRSNFSNQITRAKSYIFGTAELLNTYLDYRKPQLAPATYKKYVTTFKPIAAAVCQDLQDQLSVRNSIVNYLNIKTGKLAGASTRIGTLELLSTACNWGIREEYLPETYKNKFSDYAIEMKHANKGLIHKPIPLNVSPYVNPVQGIRAWTLEERDIIIKAFHDRRTVYPYNQLDPIAYLVEFLFLVGCRHGEAFALNWRDVLSMDDTGRLGNFISITKAWDSHTNVMKGTKTGKHRTVPLSPRCMEILDILRPPGAEMNSLIFKPWKASTFRSAGLNGVWGGSQGKNGMGVVSKLVKEGILKRYMEPYSTRRTFVSTCINVYGISIPTVAKWIGDEPKALVGHYAAQENTATTW